MGNYQATLIAGQTLEFVIPAPCYSFKVTNTSSVGSATAYVTGDGTQPTVPLSETVSTGTQVAVPAGIGPVVVRPLLPGSNIAGPPPGGTSGTTGTTFPTVLLISSGTPTVIVEW